MGIKVINLSKSFGKHKVLDDINLEISDGEFICIIGQSGCGKTTLLRIIAGFLPYEGQVLDNEEEVVTPSPNRFMIFQEFDQLLPWKTAFENIEFGLKLKKIEIDREKKVMEILSMIGLEKFKDIYPHKLSGGMKQRVAIGRSLIMNPSTLLMDEPFGSLDAQMRRRLQDELIKIWKKLSMTIIFVTHNIRESISLADRIIVLNRKGKIERIVEVNLPRPRRPSYSKFVEIWKQLLSDLGGEWD